MSNLIALVVGPLAVPECRRSVARGWPILVRTLAASAAGAVTLVALWFWWISRTLDPYHQPYVELRLALTLVEGMMVTLALVLGPALLAGSLAGERERGSLALLLTTRVSAREIVAGRIAGKLSQLAMVVLAAVPALVLTAALAGFGPRPLLAALLLPAAVGFGGGGLAAAASTLSRRGRDALLSVYIVDVFLLLTPLSASFGLPRGAFDWVSAFNPFIGFEGLIARESVGGALASAALWVALGVAGTAVASWRLRPSCSAPADGATAGRGRVRHGFVPPVDEARPMVWKELFIERVATLGRFGRWAGLFLVVGLTAVSTGFTGLIVWAEVTRGGGELSQWGGLQFHRWVGETGGLVACLIQAAVGLRASVSISSERERGTWDALLTSPLAAGEIVRGKLYGSLFALRWLILAALLAWTLGAATGAVPLRDAVGWGVGVFVVGGFLAAVGVRTSLACATATRAMSVTIGAWLGAFVAVTVTSGIVILVGLLLGNAVRLALAQLGLLPAPMGVWAPVPGYIAWPLTTNALYLAATLVLVADTRLRFDRIAGRTADGAVAVAVDEFLYGRPEEAVPIEAGDDASASAAGGWSEPPPPAGQRREDAVAPSA